MTRYLLDIRQMGPVRHQIHALCARLEEKFPIRDKQVVPHITLAGPFSTDDEERLVRDFTRICEDQAGTPKYEVGGYGFFDASRVVFVSILPDETLRQFRAELAEALCSYCTLRAYDLVPADEFRFHSTLAMKLDWLTFQRIKWYFRDQEPVLHRPHPVRATLLRDSRVLCEYDFARRRMLTGAQARSRATFMRDRDSLRLWGDEPGT
ncbi:2'-5' RNA ligase family protein [Methanoregula sp.]|uniref:2'-5' RNA ligase family protein n=1 Tax=Methanoregula sp. TaxID=2052170 RepID=UPI002D0344A2|nr:2'-5' RNA ligase family protein [Methanoregula sp.]HVP96036.1 2'-5' RNA ligase family protein [Methanoregula sp.]